MSQYEFSKYVFLAIEHEAVIKGYFYHASGCPIQVNGALSFAGTIGTDKPVTLAEALGLAEVPSHAAGFAGRLSGAVAFCPASTDGLTIPEDVSAEMVAHPDRFPVMAATDDLKLGN